MMPYLRRTGYTADNGVFYLLQDHLHSSSALLTQAGALATGGRAYYLPFGGVRSGQVNLTAKRFTGQYHEASLPGGEGLYDYGARWYDARLGRFVSPDSLVPNPANPQDLNRFSYVRNNPLGYTDPTGHLGMPMRTPGDGGGGRSSTPGIAPHTPSRSGWNPALGGSLLQMTHSYSTTYGVPWQITAGVLESEMALDTSTPDYFETWAFRAAPGTVTWLLAKVRATVDPGPGIGNTHLSTARATSTYFATWYPHASALQLGYENLTTAQLAQRLSWDDENIRLVAAIVRMLADYRFGTGGQPALGSHANLRTWSGADAAVTWHGYRYGAPEPISPGGRGFRDVEAFQERGLSVDAMLKEGFIRGVGNPGDSIQGSYPMFSYYFGQ